MPKREGRIRQTVETIYLGMLKRIFITGLTAIIPLVITIYVVVGLFYFADGILGKFINKYFVQYIGYENWLLCSILLASG